MHVLVLKASLCIQIGPGRVLNQLLSCAEWERTGSFPRLRWLVMFQNNFQNATLPVLWGQVFQSLELINLQDTNFQEAFHHVSLKICMQGMTIC